MLITPSLKTSHRTAAQARRSAYNDPVGLAEYLLSTGQPLPLDLQDDLEALGIMVDEFCRLNTEAGFGNGFQLVDPLFQSPTLSD